MSWNDPPGSASGALFHWNLESFFHLRDRDFPKLECLNSLFECSLDGIIIVCPAKIRGTFLHHRPNYTPLTIILNSVTFITLQQDEVAAEERK